jgi:hypothetical protein
MNDEFGNTPEKKRSRYLLSCCYGICLKELRMIRDIGQGISPPGPHSTPCCQEYETGVLTTLYYDVQFWDYKRCIMAKTYLYR